MNRKEFLQLFSGALCLGMARSLAARDLPDLKESEPGADTPLPFRFEETERFTPGIQGLKDLAFDSEDRLYLAGKGGVLCYGENRRERLSISPAQESTCLAIDGGDNLYVGSTRRILKFDSRGRAVADWDPDRLEQLALSYVTSLTVLGDFLFIADAGARCIHRFAANGDYVDTISDFLIPSPYFDCAPDPQGRLWVGNTGRHKVQCYAPDGRLLQEWGDWGTQPEQFCGCCNPTNLAVMKNGEILTTEKGVPQLKAWSPKGRLLAHLGPEHFPAEAAGISIALNSRDHILLAEPVEGVIRACKLQPNPGTESEARAS